MGRQVAVIAASGFPAAQAVQATRTAIPFVFVLSSDSVETGLVDSLHRPGGNITGVFSTIMDAKRRLEILHEVIPTAGTIAILVNPTNPIHESQEQLASVTARAIGLQLRIIDASGQDDLLAAFSTLAALDIEGLVVLDDDFFESRSAQLGVLAMRHSVPTVFNHRAFVGAGGLISYGSNIDETHHQFGAYVGLILKGAKPAELPVYHTSKIEFIVNLKIAKSLGLAVPNSVLDRANGVIQ